VGFGIVQCLNGDQGDALLRGIPNAEGTLIDGADHKLIWTHTRQLADLIGT